MMAWPLTTREPVVKVKDPARSTRDHRDNDLADYGSEELVFMLNSSYHRSSMGISNFGQEQQQEQLQHSLQTRTINHGDEWMENNEHQQKKEYSNEPHSVSKDKICVFLEKKTLLLLFMLSFILVLLNVCSVFPCVPRMPNVVTLEGGQFNKEKEKIKDDDELLPARENATHPSTPDHENGQPALLQEKYGHQNETFATLQNHFLPFNETNPYNSSWCPKASCHNSPICAPCNKRFLFILATGRSGSTSLLTMMNKLPNVQLSGENNNELYVASMLETNLKNRAEFHFDQEVKNEGPWLHNAIPVQAMACATQKVMATIDPPPAEVLLTINTPNHPSLEEYEQSWIFGAKIIRIQQGRWTPEEAVTFFQENFPCSRYIVNISSNIEKQAKSRISLHWGSTDYETQVKGLTRENEYLKKFASLMGADTAQVIDLEEWAHDLSIINNIMDWMGYKDCHFQEVLHQNNNQGYATDSSHDSNMSEKCHYATHLT